MTGRFAIELHAPYLCDGVEQECKRVPSRGQSEDGDQRGGEPMAGGFPDFLQRNVEESKNLSRVRKV